MFKILVSSNPDPVFMETLALLKDKGFELEEFEGGDNLSEALLAQSKISLPDLILLNPELPEKMGLKACKHLKSNPQTDGIPVVFIHTHQNGGLSNNTIIESLESGATDFIEHPEESEQLLARIHAAIRTKMSLSKSKALADQLTQMNAELYERNLAVEKELYTTRQLQQSLLPPFLPDECPAAEDSSEQLRFSKCHYRDAQMKISGVYLPCDALGGDIYDVIQFADKTIGVAIADVSGHGVPAAFVTAIFKASFYRTTHNYSLPGDLMYHLNNELINIIKTGQYITGVYCRMFDINGKKRLQFSGAGHPYPFYYEASTGKMKRLEENGTPLAWFKDMEYPMGELTLSAGDKLLMFSDGISEMKNNRGEMYGEEALGSVFEKLIQDSKQNPNLNVLDGLFKVLSDFTEGHPLDDDISVVLIEMV